MIPGIRIQKGKQSATQLHVHKCNTKQLCERRPQGSRMYSKLKEIKKTVRFLILDVLEDDGDNFKVGTLLHIVRYYRKPVKFNASKIDGIR